MKLSTLIMVALLCLLGAFTVIYQNQLWSYFSTLYCLTRYESVGCT